MSMSGVNGKPIPLLCSSGVVPSAEDSKQHIDNPELSIDGFMNYIQTPKPKTFAQRVADRVFPFKPCDLPESPSTFKDVLISKSRSSLGVIDRLRVLVTGKVEVETRIVTAEEISSHRTASVIRCGRFHE